MRPAAFSATRGRAVCAARDRTVLRRRGARRRAMGNPADAVEEAKGNKRVALLIAALALALALTEVAGDDAKTEAQMKNVESANLWAFFQAKTVRQTAGRSLSEDRKSVV